MYRPIRISVLSPLEMLYRSLIILRCEKQPGVLFQLSFQRPPYTVREALAFYHSFLLPLKSSPIQPGSSPFLKLFSPFLLPLVFPGSILLDRTPDSLTRPQYSPRPLVTRIQGGLLRTLKVQGRGFRHTPYHKFRYASYFNPFTPTDAPLTPAPRNRYPGEWVEKPPPTHPFHPLSPNVRWVQRMLRRRCNVFSTLSILPQPPFTLVSSIQIDWMTQIDDLIVEAVVETSGITAEYN